VANVKQAIGEKNLWPEYAYKTKLIWHYASKVCLWSKI